MRRAERLLGLCLLVLLVPAAQGLPVLLRDLLPRLPVDQQQSLLARDAQWQALTPSQRQALRARIATWDALPVTVKQQRRRTWLAWQALPAAEQLQVRAAAVAFAALPPGQQQGLRAQFAQLDTSDQHGWLLGPALGGSFPALQPLLLQVPDVERQPLLALLRTMSAQQLQQLGVLAQRTPPMQRDGLRRALLATAPVDRGSWLQSQLAR